MKQYIFDWVDVGLYLFGLPAELQDVGCPSRWGKGSESMKEKKQRKSMRSLIDVKLNINQIRHQWVTQKDR